MRRLILSRASMVKIGICLTVFALVAVVIGIVTRPLRPAPTFTIDPGPLALTAADVGTDFALLTDSHSLPPAQRTSRPLPYQQQYFRGQLRTFMTQAALSAAGRAEIGDWERQHGFEPTNPPTILGPFVTDHSGIFEIDSAVRSYHTVDAARQEYHCCSSNRESIFHNYQTPSVRLGDEADAFAGVLLDLSGVEDVYLTQEYAIHWRHGPIVSSVSIRGAHDITLDQVYRLAQIVDQHIKTALQRSVDTSGQNAQEISAVIRDPVRTLELTLLRLSPPQSALRYPHVEASMSNRLGMDSIACGFRLRAVRTTCHREVCEALLLTAPDAILCWLADDAAS